MKIWKIAGVSRGDEIAQQMYEHHLEYEAIEKIRGVILAALKGKRMNFKIDIKPRKNQDGTFGIAIVVDGDIPDNTLNILASKELAQKIKEVSGIYPEFCVPKGYVAKDSYWPIAKKPEALKAKKPEEIFKAPMGPLAPGQRGRRMRRRKNWSAKPEEIAVALSQSWYKKAIAFPQEGEEEVQKKPVTGQYSVKKYRCEECGNIIEKGTNHWGDCYPICEKCNKQTVHKCLEPIPEGYGIPEKWEMVSPKDIFGQCK